MEDRLGILIDSGLIKNYLDFTTETSSHIIILIDL